MSESSGSNFINPGINEAMASYDVELSPDSTAAEVSDGKVDQAYLLSIATGEPGKTLLEAARTPSKPPTQEQGDNNGNN